MNKSGVYVIGVSDCNEEVCGAAGRISTQSGSALEIFERSHDKEKNTKLINKVTKSGHTSTIEHIFFNLAFENVSVVVEQFMIEFRLASFTVKSRRYVDFASEGYYIPEFTCDEDREAFVSVADKMFDAYAKLTDAGIPKEDARFVLPYCFNSNFFCSLGGREMVNVLNAMIFGRGKRIKEIYELGLSLLSQCREHAPGVFTDFEIRGAKYSDATVLASVSDTQKKSTELTEVLSYTPDGEKNVARIALIESGNYSTAAIENFISDENNVRDILSQVVASSRPRALEGFNCTVRFNGVSLACLTHFARHRIQGIAIPDLIKTNRDNYIIPETVKADSSLLAIYQDCFNEMNKLYTTLIDKGYTDSQLIYCVLAGNTLDIVTTINGRELLLFMKLRSCTRAQWEIQNYAVELLSKLRIICPALFVNYGPSCYTTGACPEGKLTCGRAAEIKEKFKAL